MSEKRRIFISYAREDSVELAYKLRDSLIAAGHNTWMDTSEIHAGASWSRDLEDAIERSDIVLALLSVSAYVSEICRAEQMRAIRKNKRLLPILVQTDADRPIYLENMHYLDFSDMGQFESLLHHLVDYIETGKVPPSMVAPTGGIAPSTTNLPPKTKTTQTIPTTATALKRDVRAFRRYITDLRDEAWLGERHWWTYYLFLYTDMANAIEILRNGVIHPPVRKTSDKNRLWETTVVRLHFRPRMPELFGAEGIRPRDVQPKSYVATPVFFVFDLESLLIQADTRFSEGDVMVNPKTFKSATAFRDMPFELIYHDSPISAEERDEIISARRAQVIVPQQLPLTHLRHIWCRSEAEYETLYNLLPDDLWAQYGSKLTARTDYDLYHRYWLYVQQVELSVEGALFIFHPCHQKPNEPSRDCTTPFDVRLELAFNDAIQTIELGEMALQKELAVDLTAYALTDRYTIKLFLDDTLAYYGEYRAK
jgi:hypothetical protein